MQLKKIKKRIIDKYQREKINLSRKLFQLKMKISGNNRPSSEPYISCDNFRAHSDHIFDEVNEKTKIPNIKKGDIVFLSTIPHTNLEKYFMNIHPKIKNPYILITHNGIVPVGENEKKYIDDKIIHWYGKNVLIEHTKVTPIPIGLENLWKYSTGATNYFKKETRKKLLKENKILYHFKIATNPDERQKAFDYISKHPLAETLTTKLNQIAYIRNLNQYKFVASPPGAGEECHRTWEALYLKTIPIVPRSATTDYFEKLGLPIWNIDNWNELDNLNEKDLEKKYNELISKANFEPLWFDYWWNKIKEKQNENIN
ncbi:MAG TPA: hypothetical protein ENJ27_01950 [Candidatus Moranbacteria bacterium]|nr:hypothetical protein [Candidatus Moranbacteria bacterium]